MSSRSHAFRRKKPRPPQHRLARAALGILLLAASPLPAGIDDAWSGLFTLDTRDGLPAAWSEPFTLDTRDTTVAPAVTAVTGKYFHDGKTAFFLTELACQERIEATVDWKGQASGTVQFKRGGTVLQSGTAKILDIDVGSLSPLETITVQAVSADGTKTSTLRTANFLVMPVPGALAGLGSAESLLTTVERGDHVEYTFRNVTAWIFQDENIASLPNDTEGRTIPGCSGQPLAWAVAPGVSGSIKSDGTMKLDATGAKKKNEEDVSGLAPWNLLGREADPKYKFSFRGQYLGGQGWIYDGQGRLTLKTREATAPVRVWDQPQVFSKATLSVDIREQADIATHPGRDDIVWDLKMPGAIALELIGGIDLGGGSKDTVSGGGGPHWDLQLARDPALQDYKIDMAYEVRLVYLNFEEIHTCEHTVDLLDLPLAAPALTVVAPLDKTKVEDDADRILPFGSGAGDALARSLAAPQRSGAFRLLERAPAVRALDAGGTTGLADGESLLATDVFPYPQPSLVLTGGVPVVGWLRDNPGRASANRTELVFQSRGTDGTWTAPASVIPDDGTADFAPGLAACGDELLAVWQNTRDELEEEVTLAEALAAQEIGVAAIRGGTVDAVNLTTNECLDHSPQLAAAGGKALLTWIANPYGNPSGSAEEPNNLQHAHWDGSAWSPPAVLAGGVGMLLWTTLAFDGTNGVFVACLDTHANRETSDDQELYGASFNDGTWSSLTRLTDDAVQDANPQAAYDASGNLLLTWFRDGVLMLDDDLNLGDAVAAGAMEATSAATGYRLLTGPNGEIAVVWQTVTAEGGNDPVLLHFDRFQNRWSRPVTLLVNSNRLERAFRGCFDQAGDLHLAYTSVQIETNAAGLTKTGLSDLCALTWSPGIDLAISNGEILLDTDDPKAGYTVTATAVVANLGPLAATNVCLAFYDGHPAEGGGLTGETNLVADLLVGGASSSVSVAWTLPYPARPTVLYAVVDPALAVPDANRANNTASRSVFNQDVAVESMSAQTGLGNERVIYARIANVGDLDVSDTVAVTFRTGAETGAVIGACSASLVEPGSTFDAALVWNLDGSGITDPFTTVWAVADEPLLIDDADRANNVAATVIATDLDSDGDGLADSDELRLGTLKNQADSDGDGLSDGDEVHLHGTDPLRGDSDGDGMPDGNEIRAGTLPLDTGSLLRITGVDAAAQPNGLQLVFDSVAGKSYVVQRALDITGGWETVGEPFQAESNRVVVGIDRLPAPSRAFYRIQLSE